MRKKLRSYGTYTTNVDVDIDVAEVVAELTDDEIRAECAARGIATMGGVTEGVEEWRDFAGDRRQSRNDPMHFEVMILRMLSMANVPPLKIGAGIKV